MADFFEEALSSLGAAVSDVREKVVEEAYFGRSVSDGGGTSPTVEAPEQQAGFGSLTTTNIFDEALAEKVQEAKPEAPSQDKTPEPGGGMER